MLDILRDFLVTISALVLLLTISEIAMPPGNMKKYVKFFAGIIMLRAMVVPIFGIIAQIDNESANIEQLQTTYSIQSMQSMAKDEELYTDAMINLYLEQCKQTVIKLAQNYEVHTKEVFIDLDEKNNIEKISIYVTKENIDINKKGSLVKDIMHTFGINEYAVLID